MGTTGLIAQASGREDAAEILAILSNALALAVGLGCLLVGLWWVIEPHLLDLANPDPGIQAQLLDYLRIRVWTAPIVLATYVCSAYFIGQGMTRITMALALGMNIANLIANYVLAIELHLEIQGIAFGTVFAECGGLLVALGLIAHQHGGPRILARLHLQASQIRHMLTLNLPLFLRTLILKAVFVMLTVQAASLGATDAAALGLVLILLSTAAYALDGFAFASEIETGQSIGRQDSERLIASLWAGALTTGFATLLVISSYHLVADALMGQLTLHLAVSERAISLLPWLYGVLAVLAGSYWLDGVFIGLLRPIAMCGSMFLAGLAWLGGLWFFGTTQLEQLLAAFVLFGSVRTLSLGLQLPHALTQSMR